MHMTLTIQIVGENGTVKQSAAAQDCARLVYAQAYEEGDRIELFADKPGFVVARLEDSMEPVVCWLKTPFCLYIPFGEKRVSYSPKNFTGDRHLLSVRVATAEEIAARRNLALNPLDSHDNAGLYPHASANVETRGESVFAARNAVDGHYANEDHGPWPYQSWGINRNPQAEIKIDFGREVLVDRIGITLRADFPHDNWWHTADIEFSNGFVYKPEMVKTGATQFYSIPAQKVSWAVMKNMQKDETDPSPFPALTQIEFWGGEA